ncbi:arf-GAP with coiled-coil, ANK repeat and PH domain-containing protein 2 isoform X1 [Hydra vulgaris]|uniref:arf-GAP with coiled-coil, ANK repeat and PH domain-containing protein 2 isoform X1 n=2 Tax=Hydra vulgaris TaxID=6087 RepID=UPI000641570C|nr:arf-GAP with coiled-coil, ANK repeat and PH domain-containing protein 2 isoform X1 [Hydra vulgaris]
MIPELDLNECLKDSPKFRTALEEHEVSISELESHLEKLVKISVQMVEAGKSYSNTIRLLMYSLENLTSFFSADEFVSKYLKKMNGVLGDLQNYFSTFLEHAQKTMSCNINHFIKEDIKKVKETKKVFDKVSYEVDSARIRNSQLLKTCKPSDGEEAINILIATQSCFNHTALDYTFLVKSLQSKRRFYILSQVAVFLNATSTYHKRANESFDKFQPDQEELSRELEILQKTFTVKLKEMDDRHSLVRLKDVEHDNNLVDNLPVNKSEVVLDGYLFKKSSNAFKNWHRRWFVIQNNKLYYTRRSKSECVTEMVDLRLSTVKNADDCDRRFVFAVVCPTKCWYLQADNETLKSRWIAAMQMAIARALNDNSGDLQVGTVSKLHPQYLLQQISQLPGNNCCADCGSLNPKWASINLGIILCIECSGIHRSLGVQVSKVRSITLDDWDPETINLMLELGNEVVNNIYEANVDSNHHKPLALSTRAEREIWIHAKYLQKLFISPMQSPCQTRLKRGKLIKRKLRARSLEIIDSTDDAHLNANLVDEKKKISLSISANISRVSNKEENLNSLHPNLLLYRASKIKDISLIAYAFANGADVNWRNFDSDLRTALHESVISGSVTISEFLLQNGAHLNAVDRSNQTPLHYAALYGSTGHTCLFLKRDANQKSLDKDGKDPLMIALGNTHADIVTLLRLAQLHEEIKETDLNMGGDETVNNVFRDFSNMASRQSDRLKRSNRQTIV